MGYNVATTHPPRDGQCVQLWWLNQGRLSLSEQQRYSEVSVSLWNSG